MKRSIFFLSVLILVHVILLTPRGAEAVGIPFGGRIVAIVPCVCSANLLVVVADPRGVLLPLTIQPGVTLLYAYFKPLPPANTVGKFIPGGLCLIPATPCAPIPSAGTILMIGSSKI